MHETSHLSNRKQDDTAAGRHTQSAISRGIARAQSHTNPELTKRRVACASGRFARFARAISSPDLKYALGETVSGVADGQIIGNATKPWQALVVNHIVENGR